MMNKELWLKCENYLKQWNISTPEQKQEALNDLQRLRNEYLDDMGKAISNIKKVNMLIACLSRIEVLKKIPKAYLEAFGELKE